MLSNRIANLLPSAQVRSVSVLSPEVQIALLQREEGRCVVVLLDPTGVTQSLPSDYLSAMCEYTSLIEVIRDEMNEGKYRPSNLTECAL